VITEIAVAEKHAVVRTREFEVSTEAEVLAVLLLLRQERFTGMLGVNLSQGGIGRVEAEDRRRLPT